MSARLEWGFDMQHSTKFLAQTVLVASFAAVAGAQQEQRVYDTQSTPPTAAGPAAARSAQAPSGSEAKAVFKQEELEQILAPIALYPDDLLAQILMASTYPLEIVQADRWAKANKSLKGDAAAKALENEPWDASVKSLVALPDLLAMLSEKLDWTQKLGDAFIAQQADVMRVVQQLRGKAQSEGQLKSNENQKVEVSQEGTTQYITIESTNPDVVYVPVYNPTVVYGTWAYPAYPPYPYYPPAYGVGMGIAIGFAWGYAWGGCNWGHSDIDIDIDKNVDRNTNIDRSKYQRDGAAGQNRAGQSKGKFQHNPSHRQGVPYRDQATARQHGGRTTTQAAQARESFRGRSDSGAAANRAGTADRASAGGLDRSGTSARQTGAGRSSSALEGVNRGGSSARANSSRGHSSRGSMGSRSGGRGGGGRGGRR